MKSTKPSHQTARLNQQIINQSTVDLHGLSVESAREQVNRHLNVAEQTNTHSFRFITGRGNHVNNRGERGTLLREFPNWLSEEHLGKIASIKKHIGHYEIIMKPTATKLTLETLIEQLSLHWLTENLTTVQELANKNDAYYQYLLGHCYHQGMVLAQDHRQAFVWYQKSAKQDYALAQYALGGCYWQGRGVQQSDAKAIALFIKAANQGFPLAMHQLGDIYLYGQGVKIDEVKAKDYYQQASDLGVELAKRKLAHAHYFGRGTAKNEKLGFAFYKDLADKGDAHSAYNVACAYLNGGGAGKNLELALTYAKQAADKNDPDAQYVVALLYGFRKNSTGFNYLLQAASQHHKDALFMLGMQSQIEDLPQPNDYLIKAAQADHIIAQALVLEVFPSPTLSQLERTNLIQGFWQQEDEAVLAIDDDKFKDLVIDTYLKNKPATKQQRAKLLRLLNSLAQQDCARALLYLGMLYHSSDIVSPDIKKAEHYWLQGARLDDSNALCSLGYLYEERAKLDPSAYKKAFIYHKKAAALDNANSYNQLGLLYRYGQGVAKNLDKAIECLQQAITIDQDKSKSRLDGLFYKQVLPHAAYNLANLYWRDKPHNLLNKQHGCYWFIIASDAGHPQAKIFTQYMEATMQHDRSYQTDNKANFWQPASKTNPEKNRLELLQELADALELQANWKFGKTGEVWSYIEADEATKLALYSPKSMTVQKTKEGKHILIIQQATVTTLTDILKSLTLQNNTFSLYSLS